MIDKVLSFQMAQSWKPWPILGRVNQKSESFPQTRREDIESEFEYRYQLGLAKALALKDNALYVWPLKIFSNPEIFDYSLFPSVLPTVVHNFGKKSQH